MSNTMPPITGALPYEDYERKITDGWERIQELDEVLTELDMKLKEARQSRHENQNDEPTEHTHEPRSNVFLTEIDAAVGTVSQIKAQATAEPCQGNEGTKTKSDSADNDNKEQEYDFNQVSEQNFLRRNMELKQEARFFHSMTKKEKHRLENLLQKEEEANSFLNAEERLILEKIESELRAISPESNMLTSFLDLGSEKRGQDYSLDTCSDISCKTVETIMSQDHTMLIRMLRDGKRRLREIDNMLKGFQDEALGFMQSQTVLNEPDHALDMNSQ